MIFTSLHQFVHLYSITRYAHTRILSPSHSLIQLTSITAKTEASDISSYIIGLGSRERKLLKSTALRASLSTLLLSFIHITRVRENIHILVYIEGVYSPLSYTTHDP